MNLDAFLSEMISYLVHFHSLSLCPGDLQTSHFRLFFLFVFQKQKLQSITAGMEGVGNMNFIGLTLLHT